MPHDPEDAAFWQQPIELVLPLWVAMAVHGYLLLALRHPGTHEGMERPAVVRAVRRLSALLQDRGALSAAELAAIHAEEAAAEGLRPDEPEWLL